MKLSSINQAIKSLRILKTSLLTSLFVFTYHFLFSQCTSDQLEFQVEVTTDQWGYEAYWEITEQNSDCGVNTVFSGGNSLVGCFAGGLQVASASDPGAYHNNITELSYPFCLDLDSCYTFHMVDDWGDGGTSYNIVVSGLLGVVASFESQGAMNSDVFCVSAPPAYDIALDVNSELNGWDLNHIRPVPDPYYPISQLNQNETYFGVNTKNFGYLNPSGVYVRLNIDKEDVSGNWNNVFTDTLDFSNVNLWFPQFPDNIDHHFRTKEINDESWYSLGNFRYQYIAHQDSIDQNPSNDTITGYFSLTEDYWSRVTMDGDGNPNGTVTLLPGSTSAVTTYEWGSFFHFPNGSGLTVEELKTKFLISPTSQVSSFPYQARIYEVNLNGTALDMTTDITLVGIGIDTLSGNPGDTLVGNVDIFYDVNGAGAEFVLQNNHLYYISIYQQNNLPPYLNDGTIRNGLYIFGEYINHDFHIYNSNSESYPFFNPLRVGTVSFGQGEENWYNGWPDFPEPSFGIKFGGCLENSSSTQTQTACSSYQWPANGATYTNSGQYIEVLSNVNGCDSVVTLDLTINHPSATIDIQTACDSYQWIDGNTYTESTNVPALTLTNSFGCDSVVTLDLTIFNSSSSLVEQTVCDGYFWGANQTYYESTGEYSTLLTNQEGCDSLVTLDLTVNQVVITSEPLDQNVPVNESAQFSVSTNEQNTTYQWQINNGLGFQNLSDAGQYSGTNTQDLNISFVQFFQNNTQYRCILTGQTNCSDTSGVAILTVEGNASLEELKQVISIAPNPTTNLITIQSESVLNNKFKIFDQQGREVMNGKLTGKNTEVSLGELSRGTYTIQVDGNYKPAVIIKQ